MSWKPIQITERIRPYSTEISEKCLIPGTTWSIAAAPSFLAFTCLDTKEAFSIELPFKALPGSFTLMQDLERGEVRVFGKSQEGFVSFLITSTKNEIVIFLKRLEASHIDVRIVGSHRKFVFEDNLLNETSFTWKKGQKLKFEASQKHFQTTTSLEKLSLGNNKSQDWRLIQRRANLKEILPIWYMLSQYYQTKKLAENPLFDDFDKALTSGNNLELQVLLPTIFSSCFKGLMVPDLSLGHHLGFIDSKVTLEDPFSFLAKSLQAMRALFIETHANKIVLLPHLLPELHCGRIINAMYDQSYKLDVEWTKGYLRRVVITSYKDQEIELILQPELKSCRMREKKEDGQIIIKKGDCLSLKKGKSYHLDCFQK